MARLPLSEHTSSAIPISNQQISLCEIKPNTERCLTIRTTSTLSTHSVCERSVSGRVSDSNMGSIGVYADIYASAAADVP